MNGEGAKPSEAADAKRLRLRYLGVCVLCGRELTRGTEVVYHTEARTIRCVECPAAPVDALPVDTGVAGASARRGYERRHDGREARVKGRLGNFLGGVVLAFSDDPQSTRAWSRGAVGEQKLASALEDVEGLVALNDRRVPGTRGNIDHILISPAGVFVVDAKHYRGLIRIQDVGGWFKTDLRLYVGSRDCSKLAENMAWQTAAVRRVLAPAFPEIQATPVLCFVDGEWPLLSPPDSYRGVCLEGARSIKKLVTQTTALPLAKVEELTRVLATAFPAKVTDVGTHRLQ